MISVEQIDVMGSDLSVVNAARVSFEKESDWAHQDMDGERLFERDQKLITYLAKHNHKSPFNHAFASFRVQAPVFVARQLVKHEYLPWNEVSRRYVDSDPVFYEPEVWRKKAEDKKQGSLEEPVTKQINWYFMGDDFDSKVGVTRAYEDAINVCAQLYIKMLNAGVCPEQARMILPQSMMTEWIWSGSVYAFAKMCKLRLSPHTQLETRLVAEKISAEMQAVFPVSWAALMEHINV
jgi:thymidylate synthase (FAD)